VQNVGLPFSFLHGTFRAAASRPESRLAIRREGPRMDHCRAWLAPHFPSVDLVAGIGKRQR